MLNLLVVLFDHVVDDFYLLFPVGSEDDEDLAPEDRAYSDEKACPEPDNLQIKSKAKEHAQRNADYVVGKDKCVQSNFGFPDGLDDSGVRDLEKINRREEVVEVEQLVGVVEDSLVGCVELADRIPQRDHACKRD